MIQQRYIHITVVLLCMKTCYGISIPDSVVFDDRFETIKRNRDGKEIFIESGTGGGDGIFTAIAAGFTHFYSIEILPHNHLTALRKLCDVPNVHLYLGDSPTQLKKILPKINKPALFWLDAHFGDRAIGENSPILEELKVIARQLIKNHTILIDDMRYFDTKYYDFITKEEIETAIYAINPRYIITYENGFVKNDVLVAKVQD